MNDWTTLIQPPFEEVPTDSPLESLFLHHAVKYFQPGREIQQQVQCPTMCGRFRLDFMVDTGTGRVAFECDGADFHDAARDELRDALILGDGYVDVIYRIPGWALWNHPTDCFVLMATRDPAVFGERGLRLLERFAMVADTGGRGMERRSLERRFMRQAYARALQWRPRSLDEFQEQYRRRVAELTEWEDA